MAAGGHSSMEKHFSLPSGIKLIVCHGDISKTAAIAITTGEDVNLSGIGAVSKVLLKLCPKTYKEERQKMKKNAKKLEFGDVYSCSSGKNGTRTGSFSFDTVYHAIVPSAKAGKNWEETMEELYMHLWNAADKDGKKSLAVPLLGTGGAGASIDDAVKPFIDSLVKFRHKSTRAFLTDIIVYCQRDEAVKKLTAKMEDKLKHLPSASATSGARSKSDSKQLPSSKLRGSTASCVSSSSNAGADSKRMSAFSKEKSTPKSPDCDDENSNLSVILQTEAASTVSQSTKPTRADSGRTGAGSVSLQTGSADAGSGLKKSGAVSTREGSRSQKTGTRSGSVENVQDDFARLSVKDDGSPSSNTASILRIGGKDCMGAAGNGNDCNQDDDDDSMIEGMEIDDQVEAEEKAEASKKDTTKQQEEEGDNRCPICLDEMEAPKKLEKCGHVFCKECIEGSFRHHKPVCPTCNTVYGLIIGNQPPGTMAVSPLSQSLPGYMNCGILMIDYHFHSGMQTKEHPHPGHMYTGTRRRAFLPNNAEGVKVCRLLRAAFDNRLTFTVGRSTTTGVENTVTWNDIHHKTSIDGGPTGFGYPDPHYLSRVKEELAARGVTEECLKDPRFKFDV